MEKIDYIKQCVINNSKNSESKRHIFYSISEKEILDAEKMMGRSFPKELREFYMQIGYGFLCREVTAFINRLMHPKDVADFYLANSPYNEVDRDIYEQFEFIFFHIDGEDFLSLDLRDKNSSNVLYFGKKIASSISEFIIKMYKNPNYYFYV